MRDIFTRAIDYLEMQKETELFVYELTLTWASLETHLLKDEQEMNKIMNKFIHKNGEKAEAWINYVNLSLFILFIFLWRVN